MALTITVHSLRGGTGKTLVSMNLAAHLCKQGYRVVVLDMDIGAPSLHTYVSNTPQKYINDYFLGSASLDSILLDTTDLAGQNAKGQMFMGLSNDKANFISKLSDLDKQKSMEHLYKLINLVNEVLPTDPWNADIIILDTSPGFSKESLNCVAAADHLILMMRLVNADLGGTGEMLKTLHMGLKPDTSLILNQVPITFVEDEAETYTRDLVKKHIIEPIGSDKIQIAGFITNDLDVLDKEGEFAMYYLEGLEAKRPVHVIENPNGRFASHISKIAEYVVGIKEK